MVVDKPKYRDLIFESKEEFEKWLKETATIKVEFEDDGQDFLEWFLDDRGEVLHSDMQCRIWNGKMVDVANIRVGRYLMLQGGDYITHNVSNITQLNIGCGKEIMTSRTMRDDAMLCGDTYDEKLHLCKDCDANRNNSEVRKND